jgi:DNA-binding MarR family transcriptional regulator
MKLFAALRRIREFERLQLPFLNSLIDFDIIIEIGFAAEREQPLTQKQLFLLDIGSLTTVRRRLAKLVDQGVVTRHTNAKDRRSATLAVSSSSLKALTKYAKTLSAICAAIT